MPRRLPEHCVEDRDRHGNARIYLRRPGQKKVRIRGIPWTPEFMEAYQAALAGAEAAPARNPRDMAEGSWKWLCQHYIASGDFVRLDPVTQRRRRALLEATYDEPVKPGSPLRFAEVLIAKLTPAGIRVLRDRKAAKPDGANNRLKAIRAAFKWAMRPDVKLAPHNPSRDVAYIETAGEGFHTWSVDEVRQYQRQHPVGTRAHLALALLLYCGGRRSDVVTFGRQHLSGGVLRYTQHKGRNSEPMTVTVPVLPELQQAIDACPSGQLNFLITGQGKPFTSNGFGNWFRDRCNEAGLPHCSAHGLRKAAATIAAENGATTRQLMAIFGWRTEKMAEHYTKAAERKHLARSAMHLIDLDLREEVVPLSRLEKPGGTLSAKSAANSKLKVGIGAQKRGEQIE